MLSFSVGTLGRVAFPQALSIPPVLHVFGGRNAAVFIVFNMPPLSYFFDFLPVYIHLGNDQCVR
jgi:hypothetical protein